MDRSTATIPPWANRSNKIPASYQPQSQLQYQEYSQSQHPFTSIPAPFTMPNTYHPTKRSHDLSKVDSWRSYSADATNLQSAVKTGVRLNATAPTFEPSMSIERVAALYTPYEPLRVSNGTSERAAIDSTKSVKQQANGKTKTQKKKKKNKAKATAQTGLVDPGDFMNAYGYMSNTSPADQPLPSIEVTNSVGKPVTHSKSSIPHIRRVTPRATKTESPEAPATTAEYRAAARKAPVILDEPKKLLIILDLNGTLLYRSGISREKTNVRPGVAPFLDYIFEKHTVMIYTSARPENAAKMVNGFLHPAKRNKLAAIWARDQLDLTPDQYHNKVQVYKKLDKVWRDDDIQRSAGPGCKWDQSNTILLDDSHVKALAQPYNLVQVPEYLPEADPQKIADKTAYASAYKAQQEIMKQLQSKIEELQCQADVSCLIHKWQAGEKRADKILAQQIDVNEQVDQCDVHLEDESNVLRGASHLPTPDSLEELHSEADQLQVQGLPDDNDSQRHRSVSSINESVFRELLEGTGKA